MQVKKMKLCKLTMIKKIEIIFAQVAQFQED